jgi:hypothetical protein
MSVKKRHALRFLVFIVSDLVIGYQQILALILVYHHYRQSLIRIELSVDFKIHLILSTIRSLDEQIVTCFIESIISTYVCRQTTVTHRLLRTKVEQNEKYSADWKNINPVVTLIRTTMIRKCRLVAAYFQDGKTTNQSFILFHSLLISWMRHEYIRRSLLP